MNLLYVIREIDMRRTMIWFSIQYNKSLPSISSGIPSGTLGGFANSQQVTARSVAVCWTIAVCHVVWSWCLVVGTLCLTSSRLCRWVLRRHVLLSVVIVPWPDLRCHQHVDQLCCRIDLSERNHPKVPCVVPLVFRVLIGNVVHVVGEVSAHFGNCRVIDWISMDYQKQVNCVVVDVLLCNGYLLTERYWHDWGLFTVQWW